MVATLKVVRDGCHWALAGLPPPLLLWLLCEAGCPGSQAKEGWMVETTHEIDFSRGALHFPALPQISEPMVDPSGAGGFK